MFDAMKYRNSFPILEQNIQLSSCSQSAMHIDVKKAVNRYMETWEANGMEWNEWMAICEDSKKKFAQLINANPEEIAIVSSVSHAVSVIATSLPRVGRRNKVLITDDDFPCVGHVWLSQEDINTSFLSSENGFEPDDYEKITSETLLTSVSHVSYYNGSKLNLQEVAQLVHKKGSYLFVDAYQSAGQTPIDVKEMDVDFLTAGMQKYLLGIPGIAFLYVKEEIADQMIPRMTGWFGQSDPFAFDLKHVDYARGARRFDSGTFPMVNGYAANAALNVLLDIGIENIEDYLQELSRYAIDYASENNLIVKSPTDIKQKGSNTAIQIERASKMEKELKESGIIVSARNDVIRIAPHFYNTKADIKAAIDTLVHVHQVH